MLLGTAEEMDNEFMTWLAEAHDLAQTRRHIRR